jgi:hypothetical protein
MGRVSGLGIMIRKSLFWGLTLVLVAALVSLIIRGRQLEKQQAEKPAEVVEQSPSSPIRVLQPDDLHIVNSSMQHDSGTMAVHEIKIRNNGIVPYNGICVAFVYLNQAGKVIQTRNQILVGVTVFPGQNHSAANIRVEEVPASATKVQLSILSADMLDAKTADQRSGS